MRYYYYKIKIKTRRYRNEIIVTSVPYSALLPTGPSVVQGPTYRPPSLIHSSLDLLSSLHTPI